MKDSAFKLQDKSVLLFGDFNGLSQALIRDFTENGANVGFVNSDKAARFLDNINDTREVHPNFGRAAQIDVAIRDKTSAFDAVSRTAELFGRIDVVIDAKMASFNEAGGGRETSQLLIEQVEPFFKSKNRGRIVFIREDESSGPLLPDGLTYQLHADFIPWTQTLTKNWPAPLYGVNSVTIGVTEDLILKKFPKSPSIRASMETLQKEFPTMQLIDSNEIASVVLFLSSTVASGVSGQTLRVCRSA